MKRTYLYVLTVTLVSLLASANEQPWKIGEELLIHSGEELKFEKTTDVNASYGYLANISFTASPGSPKSFIVEGYIKHLNNGAPLERVPIYIGTNKESIPTLAGMTNCDGNFKFRLWIKEDQRAHQIQTTPNFTGYLYAMGSFEKSKFPLAFGSYTQRYSLEELHRRYNKKQNKIR